LATIIRNSAIYESINDIVFCSGVHSKKILLQSSSTYAEISVTAMLGRVNEASSWNVLIEQQC
jgi:hypothetical protein